MENRWARPRASAAREQAALAGETQAATRVCDFDSRAARSGGTPGNVRFFAAGPANWL
jgi:hypothetical protein